MTLRSLTPPPVLYLCCNVFRGHQHHTFKFSHEKISSSTTYHQTPLISRSALTFQIGFKLLYKTSHDLWSAEWNGNGTFLLGVHFSIPIESQNPKWIMEKISSPQYRIPVYFMQTFNVSFRLFIIFLLTSKVL